MGNGGNGDLLPKDCCSQCPNPAARHCKHRPLPETSRDSQASLYQPLVGPLLLSLNLLWGHCSFLSISCGVTAPFSWDLVPIKFCLYPPRICFPVLQKFCNQIPLAFKVKFPRGSQSLCWIPRLGNLLWALELLQQCENFFDRIILQFVGCLLCSSMMD